MIASTTPPTMATPRKITTITPNTRQPLSRTHSRLRPKASNTPVRSITITGTITDQIVSRIRPGTISSTRPIAMPMPASRPAANSGAMNGAAELNSEPIVWSRRPSRMSTVASTTMPWYQ